MKSFDKKGTKACIRSLRKTQIVVYFFYMFTVSDTIGGEEKNEE